MKLSRLIIIGLIYVGASQLHAQDIHFSLFHMSPLSLNPAHTGAFSGTVRIGGIYRDQWASFLNDQFTTQLIYVDAPIIRGFGANDWVGVGYTYHNDEAGSLSLINRGSFSFSAAYHKGLDKNGDNVLTLGIRAGSKTRELNTENILLGSEIDFANADPASAARGLVTQDQGLSRGEFDANYFSLGVGLMLRSKLNDDANLELGFSIDDVTQGEYNLISTSAGSDGDKRPMSINGHGRLRYQLSDLWSITPGFLFRTISGTKPEIGLQSWMGRKINDEFTLNFGAGYRFSDAAEVLVGVDYLQDLRVALSYDINLSSLNAATNNNGGFELSAYYIIKLYKKPSADPAILCPKF